MGDALTGLSSVIAAIGTIVTVYLAYKIQLVARNTDGTLSELRDENLALGERVTGLLAERDGPA